MRKLLTLSIFVNVVLAWFIVLLCGSHIRAIESIEVSWESSESLLPRQFNEEEKSRIQALRPSIETFVSDLRSHTNGTDTESEHNPFYIRDIDILPEKTTIQISFFRDLLNESYQLSWEMMIPPLYSEVGSRNVHITSDDFMPRIFRFDDQGTLVEPK